MVYEMIKEGLSRFPLDRFQAIMLTSDGNRDIYKDFKKFLGLFSESEYFYIIVRKNDLLHIHMIVKDCPFFKYQIKTLWLWLHNCEKINLKPVRNVEAIAVYFATNEDYIDFVGCSRSWLF
jgi:hypothetical protein